MRFLLCRRMLLWSVLLVGLGYSLPAFPGAEGFGARTPGGRGGKVFVVNTTSDKPGVAALPDSTTLREAVEATGPRTVVFNVAGMIELDSSLRILNPNLTIAGQTAPGDGICLKASDKMSNALIQIHTNDIIIRYLRIRPGEGHQGNDLTINVNEAPIGATTLDNIQTNMDNELDGIAIFNGAENVVIDHCSISWAVDENISIIDVSGSSEPSPKNISIQNSMVYQALARSIHPKGLHSMGMLAGFGRIENVSIIRNVFALNNDRNPLLKTTGPIEVVNNIFYGYGNYHGAGTHFILNDTDGTVDHIVSDVINNAYIRRDNDTYPTDLRVLAKKPDRFYVKLFTEGNYGSDEERALSLSDFDTDNNKHNGVSHWFVETARQVTDSQTNRRAVSTVMATMLDGKLHNKVGANFPKIDVADSIITENVKTFQGEHVNSVTNQDAIIHHEGTITQKFSNSHYTISLGTGSVNTKLDRYDTFDGGVYKNYLIKWNGNSGTSKIISYDTTTKQIKLSSSYSMPVNATYQILVDTSMCALEEWPEYKHDTLPDGSNIINIDADSDGMTDSWEAIYNVSSHSADPDNDGYTNIEEFLNGTTPNYIRVNGDASKGIRPLLVSPVEVPIAEYAAVRNILPNAFDLSGKPVTDVTWYDAVEYCNALSEKCGLEKVYTIAYNPFTLLTTVSSDLSRNGFRLPTKAEWEYLYLGGVDKDEYGGYYWDYFNSSVDANDYCWSQWNANNDTQPVGQLIPNGYGLYDMAGNVTEYVHDGTGDDNCYVKNGSVLDIVGEMDYSNDLGPREKDNSHNYRGFRVVRNAPIDMTPINMLLLD